MADAVRGARPAFGRGIEEIRMVKAAAFGSGN
jgi:hypothetical protein